MKALNRITLVVLLLGSLSAQAAPLCRSVFQAPLTQEQIEATLNELAHLKIQIDLDQINGSSVSQSPMDQALFEMLLNDFVGRTSMPPHEAKNQISQRISSLQNRELHRDEGRKYQREDIAQFLKPRTYKLVVHKTDISWDIGQIIAADLESFTYVSGKPGGLLLGIHSFSNPMMTVYPHSIAGLVTTENKRKIYAIDEAQHLQIIDTKTLKPIQPPLKIKDFPGFAWRPLMDRKKTTVAVSPSENLISIKRGGHLYIVRSSDGEVLYSKTAFGSEVKFHSDDEIYIYSANRIVKLNWRTGTEVVKERFDNEQNKLLQTQPAVLWIHNDTLTLQGPTQITTFAAGDLSIRNIQQLGELQYQTPVPDNREIFLAMHQKVPALYNNQLDTDPTPAFKFNEIDVRSMKNMIYTDDGNGFLFHYEAGVTTHRNGMKSHLEIWVENE